MKRFRYMMASLAVVLGLGVFAAAPTGAVNVFKTCNGTNSDSSVCAAKNDDDVNSLVQIIVEILLWAIAVISVIMIVVGGLRYVISGGDAAQIKAARETIVYAVVGLVVAILSFAIVKFVLRWF